MAKTVILIDDDQDDLDVMKEAIKALDKSILCISFVYPDDREIAFKLLSFKKRKR